MQPEASPRPPPRPPSKSLGARAAQVGLRALRTFSPRGPILSSRSNPELPEPSLQDLSPRPPVPPARCSSPRRPSPRKHSLSPRLELQGAAGNIEARKSMSLPQVSHVLPPPGTLILPECLRDAGSSAHGVRFGSASPRPEQRCHSARERGSFSSGSSLTQPCGSTTALQSARGLRRSTTVNFTDALNSWKPRAPSQAQIRGSAAKSQDSTIQLLDALFDFSMADESANFMLQVNPELAWLADCLQRCPLPTCWSTLESRASSDTVKYVDMGTCTVADEHPLMHHFVELSRIMLFWRSNLGQANQVVDHLAALYQQHVEQAKQMRTVWNGPLYDPSTGVEYWHCPRTGRSTWGNPGAADDFLANVIAKLKQAVPVERCMAKSSNHRSAGSVKPIQGMGTGAHQDRSWSRSRGSGQRCASPDTPGILTHRSVDEDEPWFSATDADPFARATAPCLQLRPQSRRRRPQSRERLEPLSRPPTPTTAPVDSDASGMTAMVKDDGMLLASSSHQQSLKLAPKSALDFAASFSNITLGVQQDEFPPPPPPISVGRGLPPPSSPRSSSKSGLNIVVFGKAEALETGTPPCTPTFAEAQTELAQKDDTPSAEQDVFAETGSGISDQKHQSDVALSPSQHVLPEASSGTSEREQQQDVSFATSQHVPRLARQEVSDGEPPEVSDGEHGKAEAESPHAKLVEDKESNQIIRPSAESVVQELNAVFAATSPCSAASPQSKDIDAVVAEYAQLEADELCSDGSSPQAANENRVTASRDACTSLPNLDRDAETACGDVPGADAKVTACLRPCSLFGKMNLGEPVDADQGLMPKTHADGKRSCSGELSSRLLFDVDQATVPETLAGGGVHSDADLSIDRESSTLMNPSLTPSVDRARSQDLKRSTCPIHLAHAKESSNECINAVGTTNEASAEGIQSFEAVVDARVCTGTSSCIMPSSTISDGNDRNSADVVSGGTVPAKIHVDDELAVVVHSDANCRVASSLVSDFETNNINTSVDLAGAATSTTCQDVNDLAVVVDVGAHCPVDSSIHNEIKTNDMDTAAEVPGGAVSTSQAEDECDTMDGSGPQSAAEISTPNAGAGSVADLDVRRINVTPVGFSEAKASSADASFHEMSLLAGVLADHCEDHADGAPPADAGKVGTGAGPLFSAVLNVYLDAEEKKIIDKLENISLTGDPPAKDTTIEEAGKKVPLPKLAVEEARLQRERAAALTKVEEVAYGATPRDLDELENLLWGPAPEYDSPCHSAQASSSSRALGTSAATLPNATTSSGLSVPSRPKRPPRGSVYRLSPREGLQDPSSTMEPELPSSSISRASEDTQVNTSQASKASRPRGCGRVVTHRLAHSGGA